jgi:iron complex transport system substrate-binding protein
MASCPAFIEEIEMKGKLSLFARLLLTVSALLICFSGCRTGEPPAQTTPAAGASNAGFPRTLRDGGGAEVIIKARPVRILSQTLGTDEILWAICPRERIAGVSKIGLEPKYSPIADELKAAKSTPISNAEEILQLQPDLVFVASFSRAETVESLKLSGAPVFRFANFDSIEDIQQNIRLVGQAIGEAANAEKLVAQMNDELAAVKARIPAGGKPPRVLSFSLPGNTAGAGTSFDSIVRAAGAVNVAAEKGLRGFPKISPEQVVEWQPDFLLTGTEAAKAEQAKTRLLDHPVIATTKAARAGHIIVLDSRYLLSVSQYVTRAVSDLADALYGAEAKMKTKAAAK